MKKFETPVIEVVSIEYEAVANETPVISGGFDE